MKKKIKLIPQVVRYARLWDDLIALKEDDGVTRIISETEFNTLYRKW